MTPNDAEELRPTADRGWPAACWRWLVEDWNWPAAGLVAAVLIGGLLPAVCAVGSPALGLVAAQLPLYLVHQGEEHIGDRFRRHINAQAGGDALSRPATFWINSLGVWGVDLVAIGLAAWLDLAWGFLAVYLTLINAAVHLLAGIVRRESNPGLVTALVLFLPLGGAAWWTLQRATGLGAAGHMFFAALVVLEHVLIVAWVVARRGREKKEPPLCSGPGAGTAPRSS